jgi:hypothetical protein
MDKAIGHGDGRNSLLCGVSHHFRFKVVVSDVEVAGVNFKAASCDGCTVLEPDP